MEAEEKNKNVKKRGKLGKIILLTLLIIAVAYALSMCGVLNTHIAPTMRLKKITISNTCATAYITVSRCGSKTLLVDDFVLNYNNTTITAIKIKNTTKNKSALDSIEIPDDKDYELEITFTILTFNTQLDAYITYNGKQIKSGQTILI